MATQPTDSKYRLRSNASDELAVIAQRAQAFTNASGAAIALSEGNADEIICRARSGSSAPDVGVTLRVEGSFTGLCIQSGKELRCDDAETDTRVDTVAIRSLGIRSMVVTPVKEDNKVVGVLAVFAPTPHAFTITHVAVLKTMADQISALLLKERRARDEGLHNEPVVTAPRPPASVAPPPPPPVVIKSSGSNGAAAAVAMAPARSTATAPKIEVIKTPAVVEAPAPAPVPFPRREEKRIEPALEPVARASFGTFDAVAGEQKESGNKKFMVVGVVVILAVVAVGSWFALRKSSSSAPQNAPVTAAAAPAPSPAAASTTAAPAATSTAAPAAQPVTPASSSAKPAAAEVKPESKRPEPVKPEARPAAQPSPATVAVTGGSSRISSVTAQQQQTTEAVSSNLSVGNSGSSSALSSLARPVNSATPAMIAQSELVPVQLLTSVKAVYPAIAKARRLSGTVVVRVTIGKDGKVSNPRFVSGAPVFKDAAFDSVTQWRYKPATLNGQAVEQEQEIKITFRPAS
ncbi:MAG: hypothetical protein DMG65_12700 [Candidatus Angelobacter sp. Gp1-AA117]|nr:MAG: hypothetical protein DMG65_12700 [Candidatus Angelobacter sp. Gp1-AA117]